MYTLAEELLLLGLRDEQGTVASGASVALKFGLSGALMTDLLLKGRITLDEKGKVLLASDAETGDELGDEALAQIAKRAKLRSLKDWVMAFGNGGIKRLQERLARRLVERGVLAEEEGRFLWLFPTHHFPAVDPRPEQDIRERVHRVIIQGATPDERTLMLLSLVKACKLTNEVFAEEDRKTAKARLDELTRSEASGKAVSQAVTAVQAATTAAIFAAVAASSAASSSSSS